MLELVKKEKLAYFMHGDERFMVSMPSLDVLFWIVGQSFVFEQNMDSIFRDSSWLKVTNLLVRKNIII